MSLLNFQPHNVSTTTEDFVSAEHLGELQKAIGRLQLLVCELLIENQQLRDQTQRNKALSMATNNENAR